ncbi:MAG: di-trans,poly-cis-decaprenylcistransferase [Gammaproteobacteria bacterium]|nr:di-trans,poly-cis-decaprenylcistransferase [Gammaproteobacteria bacterium]
MDGNGRWAEARGEPRSAGHLAGVEPVRKVIRECARRGVRALTLFAFSSENWRRPETEVATLMGLFMDTLEREVEELHANRVRLRIIGNRQRLAVRLQQRIAEAEALTAANDGLSLQVAVSYGGRWDVLEAVRRLAALAASGAIRATDIDEERLASELQLAGLPDPDLFIRTGGDHRVSNFLLWNIAYAELYFTDLLWPDFDENELQRALDDYAGRERRFGLTGAQSGRSGR